MSRMRNPNLMDTVTKASIETISVTGYQVDITGDDDGRYVVSAAANRGSERFIVRGAELYEAVVELAGQVGSELEDG